MDLPQRKRIRLKDFDYSNDGYYFITVCTAQKQKILCSIVGANSVRPITTGYNTGEYVGANIVRPIKTKLSEVGKIVENYLLKIDNIYDDVKLDKYVIMPNHIHLILFISNGRTTDCNTDYRKTNGRTMFAPTTTTTTVSQIIKQFKGKVTKQIGRPVFQRSFYDHIIRDEKDYLKICDYIDTNPQKWANDEYNTLESQI